MPIRDTALVAGLLAVCAAVFWGARDLRPGSFEPLGPGAFPLALAGSISVLSLLLLVQAWGRRHTAAAPAAVPPDSGEEDEASVVPQPLMAVAIIVLAVIFGLAISVFRIDFAWSALAFLAVAMAIMTRFRARTLPLILLVSAISAFGADYVFTRVLVINLP